MTTALVLVPLIGAIIALLFAGCNAIKVKKADRGDEKVIAISDSIRDGASAFLARQYKTVSVFFVAVFVLLLAMSYFGLVNSYTPYAFITGGLFSGLSGFFGMKIATAANGRTTTAAEKSLNCGLRIAFSAGSVMGFVVVGLGLLDMSVWYILLKYLFKEGAETITSAMLTFGVGASSMAIFARVGGGIFTKAADVGADLVGKVEAGIPEDDPRNPAVIADNVGDNVGDVAGMGADLYESYVGSLVSSMALAFAAFKTANGSIEAKFLLLPMILAAVGILASVIGTFFVKTKENLDQKQLLKALRRGTVGAGILFAVAAFPILYFILGKENNYLGFYFSIIVGLVSGILIGLFTEYMTSDTYAPTKKLASKSETGTATVVIGGLSLGLVSVAGPIIIVAIAIIGSYLLPGGGDKGLLGIALAAVGMLSTLGITLATDAYGPVADNAGGIAEMAGKPEIVRQRTDALDSLGNTTAATGKGFAIGSAALTALALIVSYKDDLLKAIDGLTKENLKFDLTNPCVLVGLFIGAMLPFVFSALTMNSVGSAAQKVVVEVRRQFKEIPGLLQGTGKPDYRSCVDICAKSALSNMIAPALLAILTPVAVSLLLGYTGVVGMLMGATVSGFLLAIMMSNSGGAWDNAKKYIERGNFGGKGSEQHKATVVGDTVGDPLKDTSGPSINILIKLISVVSITVISLAKIGLLQNLLK